MNKHKHNKVIYIPFMTYHVYGLRSQVELNIALANEIQETHKLSKAMIKSLADFAGRFPLVDMRSIPALMRRRLITGDESSGFRLTSLGRKVCKQLFRVTETTTS